MFPVIEVKSKKSAAELVGSLSNPSKMPGKAYGINADDCIRGSRMAEVANSICSKCYAQKGNYVRFPKIKEAQDARLKAFNNLSTEVWSAAMIKLIDKEEYFRWFDSGDLQSAKMLLAIFKVVRATPKTKHWLATREQKFVADALKVEDIPENLVIRISADFIDKAPTNNVTEWSSMVHSKSTVDESVAFDCPSRFQDGKCGSCRACWDPSVKNVSYKAH